ncbi:unnamed protein product [Callosobruchus maculatus]|uniref:PiggyBac transposable element-derived protein domain-containing protein n=1 Tax=Callosobruchus maculatus TaxID=64391 RepID=A0A653D3K9_CALMS|nr:unnamed protein product [Callosobruchus maculatus]
MDTTDWNKPLTDHELEEIINAPDFYDKPSDCSGSEVDDHEEYESAEDSDCEYVPSTDDSDVDDPQPGPSKKARKISKTGMQKEARNSQQIDDNVGSSQTQQPPTSQVSLRGKNGHRWSAVAGKTSRIPMKNKTHIIQGPKDIAQEASNPLAGFSLFISDTMIDEIVIHTNNEIQVKSQNYTQEKSTTSLTTSIEIKALIGLLIFSAALKNNHLSTQELFDVNLCGSTYKATMSRERFKFLINCLRFDDKTTRGTRKETDPLAAVRVIWDQLIDNCRNYYKAGSYITIDEQLLAFRGRCPFRMYIPNKPAKYGLKIVIVCDSGTKYMIDASPYLGKKTRTDSMPLAEYYVKTLTTTLRGANRNITMDNWFSSVKLADDLLQDPYKFTMVGTLRKNKREIPSQMLSTQNRQPGDARYCFDKEKTLLSYVPRKNKNVILLSTMHSGSTLTSETTGKPDMIDFYNSTKGGVDTFDQMCGNMSTSRKNKKVAIVHVLWNAQHCVHKCICDLYKQYA